MPYGTGNLKRTHTTGETMKSAVVIFFDTDGKPVDCKLACHKEQEQQLEKVARRMMQAVIQQETTGAGPHVCRCGRKCSE